MKQSERRRLVRPQYDGARAAYSMLLGLSVFLLVGALSYWQLTSEPVAHQLISEGVAALTDIDQVLAEREIPIQASADAAAPGELLTIPGYPLDVRFTAEEFEQSSDQEFRDLVLARSADIVYNEGLDAFDQTGAASVGLFSREGLLDSLLGRLSASAHRFAGYASMAVGLLAVLAAVMVVVRSSGFQRVRALGFPIFIGAAAGALLSLALAFLLGRVWSGDPFSDEIDRIVADAIGIGTANYVIATVLGIGIIVLGVLVEVVARFAFREAPDPAFADDLS